RAIAGLDAIEAELLATGVPDGERRFNLTWHDWLNLRSLVEVSRVIAAAAKWRQNSRGAHFRADFPAPGDFASPRFSIARPTSGKLALTDAPVVFAHVRPGETLVKHARSADEQSFV